MRIISGRYRGKTIHPGKFSGRPTTDMSREGLFNVINNSYHIENLKVLDLFSGTGSISYEFASRGCEEITAVENNPKHAAFIEKTARELGMSIRVCRLDAFRYLRDCRERYDLIFADPPYDMEGTDTIPGIVFGKELLQEEGILIIEHSNGYDLTGHEHFSFKKTYGKVIFSFFE